VKIDDIEMPTIIVGSAIIYAATIILFICVYLFISPKMDAQSLATMLGSILGAAVAVLAVILGNYYTAHLEKKQVEKMHDEQRKGLAGALLAEVIYLTRKCAYSQDLMKNESNTSSILVTQRYLEPIELITTQVYNQSAVNLLLFPPNLSHSVVDFYAHVHALKYESLSQQPMFDNPIRSCRRIQGYLKEIDKRAAKLSTKLGMIAFPEQSFDEAHWRSKISIKNN
jgi:cadmium resistance protein CadD (predicted permease)